MSDYKEQHYIPKAILRNFCHSGKQLWFYNKERPQKGVDPRNVKSVFFEHHAATIWRRDAGGLVADHSVEAFFSKEIENHLPKIISNLAGYFTGRRKRDLAPEEKRYLVQFFYNHMLRTPDVMGSFLEKTVSNLDLQESAKDLKWKDNVRARALAHQNKEILEELFKGRVAIATPRTRKKQFIVASNPVLRLHQKNRANWLSGDVELWTALTPKLAVGILNEPGPLIGYKLSNLQVRDMNVMWAKQSRSIAGSSKELVTSLLSYVNG
ncbi:hypothetical protein TRL7639_02293 [Falsiruegeria litorea R37]|uniref:DUF4238 domain-containing protein n=1 Tax=Falsiruegeria litorea R37 TaxID=1200284 RepID=A0A1Y5SMR6_9RHOB|nr:DUF4238 domain-containing protein [Falsiruegeria litorea]SLN43706.1 hypothetical protein TRL7639_02293 [Falsiruegeria litorea R37]